MGFRIITGLYIGKELFPAMRADRNVPFSNAVQDV